MKLLIIDHYDSFSATISDYCAQIWHEQLILKTDQLMNRSLATIAPNHIIIGPGPGHPSDKELLATKQLMQQAINCKIPLLGICLGHQLLAQLGGANIITAQLICHGQTSKITHLANGIFHNLPQNFAVTRYHSLLVDNASLNPRILEISAQTSNREIMALNYLKAPAYGIQFHPESVMSEYGMNLLNNFKSI